MNGRKLLAVLGVIGTICGAYWLGTSQTLHDSQHLARSGAVTLDDYVGFWPAQVDLGAQPWNSEVPFAVTFVNRSPAPVKIAAAKSCCGCRILERTSYADIAVDPGGEVSMRGTLDVGQVPGEHRKKVDALLNSGSMHSVFLEYLVFATYEFKPSYLDFGEVSLGDRADEVSASVVFSSETVSVVGVKTDSPWIEARDYERAEGELEIVVRIVARYLAHGNNAGRVLVSTDDPWRPSFAIPVRARGACALRPIPAHVFLRRAEVAHVRFVTTAGEHAQIVDARPLSDGVHVTIGPDGAEVTVSLDAGVDTAARPVIVSDHEGHTGRILISAIE